MNKSLELPDEFENNAQKLERLRGEQLAVRNDIYDTRQKLETCRKVILQAESNPVNEDSPFENTAGLRKMEAGMEGQLVKLENKLLGLKKAISVLETEQLEADDSN